MPFLLPLMILGLPLAFLLSLFMDPPEGGNESGMAMFFGMATWCGVVTLLLLAVVAAFLIGMYAR